MRPNPLSNKSISSMLDRIANLLDAKGENQWTVIMESRGVLKRKRVIRGREMDSTA